MIYTYKTEGIIIRRVTVGEADRILTVLTPHYGKIKLIAKGIRKITSRRAPNLELFTRCLFVIRKGKSGDYIIEAKAISSYDSIHSSLVRIRLAYQLAELTNILTRENQELEGVYDLLSVSLKRIQLGIPFDMDEFKNKLLFLLGFLSEQADQDIELDSYIEEIAQRHLYTRKIYE